MTLPLHRAMGTAVTAGAFPLLFILDHLHRSHGEQSEYDHGNRKRTEIIL